MENVMNVEKNLKNEERNTITPAHHKQVTEDQKEKISILLVEDADADAALIQLALQRSKFSFSLTRVETRESFIKELTENTPDLILSDYTLPNFHGLAALELTKSYMPWIPFIIVTGSITEETAVNCIKAGAADYIIKERLTRLESSIKNALERRREYEEKVHAEKALKQSEERYRMLFDASPLPMWVFDVETFAFLAVNEAAIYQYGYSREEFLSMTIKDIRPPNEISRLLKDLDQKHTGLDVAGAWKHKKKDGNVIDVEITSHEILYSDRKAKIVLAIDVTERKRAEEEVKRQTSYFRQLFDNSPAAIVLLDACDCVLNINPAFQKVFQYTIDELKGKQLNDVIIPPTKTEEAKKLSTSTQNGQTIYVETQRQRKNGSLVDVQVIGFPIAIEARQVGIYGIYVDITDQKKLESQFLRAQRMESIGTLAGGVAHDLNNVLAPILMAVDIFKRKYKDAEDEKILNTLETSALRGAGMVKQVLTFARGLEGEYTILNITHLVKEMEKIIRETFPKFIRLKLDLPRNLYTLKADPTQLHQLLLNLCVNARDAMPDGGTLNLSAENIFLDEYYERMHPDAKPGHYVMLTVVDTGTGIPQHILEKIFEPFFTTKEIGKGTGLGLSTVHSIVKSHGGFISVYSEVGKGTKFHVYLPAQITAAEQAAVDEQKELPVGHGETILLIDDEASIREICQATLLSYGYNVLAAADGTEAVALYAQQKTDIDLVITDMMMPFMDGATTIRALRKLNPSLKIIATSGLTSNEDLAKNESTNVQAFLQKPYTAEKLLKTLHEVFSKN